MSQSQSKSTQSKSFFGVWQTGKCIRQYFVNDEHKIAIILTNDYNLTNGNFYVTEFYLQILSTEASFYIYNGPVTEINVTASFCALN